MFEYKEYPLGNGFHRRIAIDKIKRNLIYEITYKSGIGITLRWEGEVINYNV